MKILYVVTVHSRGHFSATAKFITSKSLEAAVNKAGFDFDNKNSDYCVEEGVDGTICASGDEDSHYFIPVKCMK